MTAPEPRPLIRMSDELYGHASVFDGMGRKADAGRARARARLLRAADAVIENAGPMAWLLVAEADEQYRAALRSAIAVYRAAEKEVQRHDAG